MHKEFATLTAFLLLSLGWASACAGQARLLIIGIDAIPYEVAQRLTDPQLGEAAIFKGFKGPAAVVSSFPATSHLAWTGLLQPFGIPKAKGYEARYFSVHTRKLQGGLGSGSLSAPWHDFFDWRLRGLFRKALAYGFPKHYSIVELRRGLKAFLASEEPVFAFYIVSTDALGHADGPTALGEFLKQLDQMLTEVKLNTPNEFHTILISDHGMAGGHPLTNIWPSIRKQLKQDGFRISRRLSEDNSVVIIAYGLVSSFVVYTNPGKETLVASAITRIEGVDLCAMRTDDGLRIVSSRGDSLISSRRMNGETFWSYRTLTGDPLGYQSILESSQQASDADTDAWFSDRWWFESTKHSEYPDGLHRLMQSFQLVQSPSSIACSVGEGYMFGARKTEVAASPSIGKLQWTHGALHAAASLGFLMSDIPQWEAPDVVRYDEALLPFSEFLDRDLLQASRSAR